MRVSANDISNGRIQMEPDELTRYLNDAIAEARRTAKATGLEANLYQAVTAQAIHQINVRGSRDEVDTLVEEAREIRQRNLHKLGGVW